MKISKVSQMNLKKSVLKPLQFKRNETLIQPSVEEMCFGISASESEDILMAESILYGDEKDLGVFALAQVMNDLATRGAQMVGVSVLILLPPYAYESRIKNMMEHMECACSAHSIQIISAKAEVNPAINKAIVHLTGLGKINKGTLVQSSNGRPEQDIVLLKWIGLEGTIRVLREKEEELSKRFIPTFLKRVHRLEEELFSSDAIMLAKDHGASAMQQITSGGILATLWEMAEASGVGMTVDLKQMSIRQETVEICEFYRLNPYQLTSAGSVLIFTDRGEELVQKYREMGIWATLLGRTTDDNARIIMSGEEKRFLDKPVADELLKIYEND